MKYHRYLVVKNNGDIAFIKALRKIFEGEGWDITVVHEYEKKTQTELCFVQECMKRFENDFPVWAGILKWDIICEDDYLDIVGRE